MKKVSQLIFAALISVFLINCSSTNDEPVDNDEAENTGISTTSEITCPKCGHKEIEELPTTQCLLFYDCKSCGETMTPEGNDCCVFCSHGTHECPSIQERNQ